MFENLKKYEHESLKVNVHFEGLFIWCHLLNSEKEEVASFRINPRYKEDENCFEIYVLKVDKHKDMKKEIARLTDAIKEEAEERYGSELRFVYKEDTPARQAWRDMTYLDTLILPMILYNLVLYFLLDKFLSANVMIGLIFVSLSIPVGLALSFGHNWGAGAPFAGFETMIRHMRYKYVLITFMLALPPYLLFNFL